MTRMKNGIIVMQAPIELAVTLFAIIKETLAWKLTYTFCVRINQTYLEMMFDWERLYSIIIDV